MTAAFTYISMLLNRTNTVTGIKYKDESAILAWELGNELRNEAGDSAVLLNWQEEMAAYIKSIDPNHLVADGGEGFDDDCSLYPGLSNCYSVGGATGNSYRNLVNKPSIDMVSYHFYPLKWGLNPTTDAEIWIRVHEELASDAGKVAYMGEFGWAGPDSQRAEVFDQWLGYSVVDYGGTGELVWQMAYDTRPDYDGFTVYCPQDDQSCSVLQCPAWPGLSPPPWPIPSNDPDCDGFSTASENFMGTDPSDHCNDTASADDEGTPDAWPFDFNDDQRASLPDVLKYIGKVNTLAPGRVS